MPIPYLLGLAATIGALLGLRALPTVPSRTLARPLARHGAPLLTVGVLGLIFHCGAMFFESTVVRLPGSGAAVDQINAMGRASGLWFAVPALLVLIGLTHQYKPAWVAVALMLVVVGVTMYDSGPLDVHLLAIFAAAVTLAATMSLLVSSRTSP